MDTHWGGKKYTEKIKEGDYKDREVYRYKNLKKYKKEFKDFLIYNIYIYNIHSSYIYMLLWSMGMISPFQGEEPSSSLGEANNIIYIYLIYYNII